MPPPLAPPSPRRAASPPATDRLRVPPVAQRQAARRVAPAARLPLPDDRHWSHDAADFLALAAVAVLIGSLIWVAGFLLGFGYLVARALAP